MDAERVRVAVYADFSRTGHAPTVSQLAESLNVAATEVADSLQALADARHLVLGPDGAIVMAHPFSALPLGFSVMGRDTLWWGGCAWDSFAIPHLLPWEDEVLVATRCPGCGRPHAWSVGRSHPPDGDQIAHFLVPAARMWDDVAHTCGNQRTFCSQDCVSSWLEVTGQSEGYVMDLSTLWKLAAHWYDGRLDHGYIRREPSEARQYLQGVGLEGTFWGL